MKNIMQEFRELQEETKKLQQLLDERYGGEYLPFQRRAMLLADDPEEHFGKKDLGYQESKIIEDEN